jgi:hypothetical protein
VYAEWWRPTRLGTIVAAQPRYLIQLRSRKSSKHEIGNERICRPSEIAFTTSISIMTSGFNRPPRSSQAFTTLPTDSSIEVLSFISIDLTPASGSIATLLVITRDPETSTPSFASFFTEVNFCDLIYNERIVGSQTTMIQPRQKITLRWLIAKTKTSSLSYLVMARKHD